MMRGAEAMAELVAVIGEVAATQIASRFGGTSVYVPRAMSDDHPLCVAIGRDAAIALAGWAGGTALAIPKQIERRARVLTLRQSSALTVAEIARETSFSERHVYRLIAESTDPRQPDLFDERLIP